MQMPPPKWVDDLVARDNRFDQYNLNPAVKQQLLEQQRRAAPSTAATTQPLTSGPAPAVRQADTDAQPVVPAQQGVVIVVPPYGGEPRQADPRREVRVDRPGTAVGPPARPAAPVTPNNLGLVIDGQGHVLVPLYVEREAVGDRPVRLIGPGGEPIDARYIGSDQQTNLTVLQLPQPAGPAARTHRRRTGRKRTRVAPARTKTPSAAGRKTPPRPPSPPAR